MLTDSLQILQAVGVEDLEPRMRCSLIMTIEVVLRGKKCRASEVQEVEDSGMKIMALDMELNTTNQLCGISKAKCITPPPPPPAAKNSDP